MLYAGEEIFGMAVSLLTTLQLYRLRLLLLALFCLSGISLLLKSEIFRLFRGEE